MKNLTAGLKTERLMRAIRMVERIDAAPRATFADRHEAHLLLGELAKGYREHVDYIASILAVEYER